MPTITKLKLIYCFKSENQCFYIQITGFVFKTSEQMKNLPVQGLTTDFQILNPIMENMSKSQHKICQNIAKTKRNRYF